MSEEKPHERSALQILAAQCEHEVEEAKKALGVAMVGPSLQAVVDALEQLDERVVRRWWIMRMAQKPPKAIPDAEWADHLKRRNALFALATDIQIKASGPINLTSMQIGLFGVVSQLDAIWKLLMEAAIASPQTRMVALDDAAQSLYARVHDFASKIKPAASEEILALSSGKADHVRRS
jgi:hypothetical protein